MPSQANSYIEPKDIRGVRFDCKSCGTPQYRSLRQADNADAPNLNFSVASASLAQCPVCKDVWFKTQPGTYDQHRENVNLFLKYLFSLEVDATMKVNVSLEISPDAARVDTN
jgi:hypothetical protein